MSRRVLHITIKGIRNMSAEWVSHEPCVRLWTSSTRDNKEKTRKASNGGTTALFNDSFNLAVNNLEADFLFLEAISEGLLSTKSIGKVKVPCIEISSPDPTEKSFKIFGDNGKEAGEVQLTVSMENVGVTAQTWSAAASATSAVYSAAPPQHDVASAAAPPSSTSSTVGAVTSTMAAVSVAAIAPIAEPVAPVYAPAPAPVAYSAPVASITPTTNSVYEHSPSAPQYGGSYGAAPAVSAPSAVSSAPQYGGSYGAAPAVSAPSAVSSGPQYGGAYGAAPVSAVPAMSNPSVYGQASAPSIYGQAPAPSVYGQAPAPSVYGQAPAPSVYGQAPAPSVYGQAPAPSVYGQAPVPTMGSNQYYGGTPAPGCHTDVGGYGSGYGATNSFGGQPVGGYGSAYGQMNPSGSNLNLNYGQMNPSGSNPALNYGQSGSAPVVYSNYSTSAAYGQVTQVSAPYGGYGQMNPSGSSGALNFSQSLGSGSGSTSAYPSTSSNYGTNPAFASGQPSYSAHMAPTATVTAIYAPTSNGLPPNWEERISPEGRSYFVNHQTQTTSWTRPEF